MFMMYFSQDGWKEDKLLQKNFYIKSLMAKIMTARHAVIIIKVIFL